MEQTDTVGGEEEGGEWGKEGEGIRQRTCMNDPWTWTTVWGLTVGAGHEWAEEGKEGKTHTPSEFQHPSNS